MKKWVNNYSEPISGVRQSYLMRFRLFIDARLT